MKELFLINGCKLKCNCGSVVSELKVTSQNFAYMQNELQATEKDNKPNENIFPFGACSLKRKKPCVPQPLEWEGKIDWNTINNVPTLTDKSTLKCALGGVINVLDAGQNWHFIEDTKKEAESKKKAEEDNKTAQITGIKNIYEIDKDGNINPIGEDTAKDKDIIYISDNFTGTGSNRKLKPTHDGGFEVGEKGYIDKNKGSYGGSDFIIFEDFDKAYNLFHWIAGNVIDKGGKSPSIIVEFSFQGFKGNGVAVHTSNVITKIVYVVTTKHSEGGVSILPAKEVFAAVKNFILSVGTESVLFDVHFHPRSDWDIPSGLDVIDMGKSVDWDNNKILNRGSRSYWTGDMYPFADAEKRGKTIQSTSYMYNYSYRKVLRYGHGGLLDITPIADLKNLK